MESLVFGGLRIIFLGFRYYDPLFIFLIPSGFQSTCVKGPQPKVGDRVLVEATYNANMPFKWNATRIQVLPNQGGVNSYYCNLKTPFLLPPKDLVIG